MGTVWAVVVAGGDGRRFGGQKQFEHLGDRLVVEWSVDAARVCVDGVVLVVPQERVTDRAFHAGADLVVAGGSTRSASVRAGLDALPDDAEVVIVHDAARPFASSALFVAVLEAVRAGAAGAIPAVAVSDTIKRVSNGVVVETLARDELVAVQTPQAFRSDALREAHAAAAEATDDAALVEAIGGTVVTVTGEPANRKLTDREDFDEFARLAAALLRR